MRGFEQQRKEVGVVIEGRLEYRDGVTNLVAQHFTAWHVAGIKSRHFR